MGQKEAFHKVKQCVVDSQEEKRESGAGEMHEDTLTEYFPKTMKDARSRKLRDQHAKEVPKNQSKQF